MMIIFRWAGYITCFLAWLHHKDKLALREKAREEMRKNESQKGDHNHGIYIKTFEPFDLMVIEALKSMRELHSQADKIQQIAPSNRKGEA